MSETFNAAAQALADNEALRNQVMSAGSAEERASILREAGVPVPTHADVNAAHAEMAGVAGGTGSISVIQSTTVVASPAASAGAAAA